MSTDLFKQVLFNDGEELTFGDQNDGQNFDQAQLTDQVLESLVGNLTLSGVDPFFSGQVQADAANHLAYCLHGGSAYLRLGSANNKVQIAPGVLFQKTGSKNGNASTFLPYYFDGSSTYEFTIAAGSASPRVDLLQMSLVQASGGSQLRDFKDAITGAITSQTLNKKRQVNCTLSVKQGTPGASPVTPDPDAGYVAVGSVVVHNTYVVGTALSFGRDCSASFPGACYDQRMPMKLTAYATYPETWGLQTAWALTTNGVGNKVAQSSSTTNSLNVRVWPGNQCSRLIGLAVQKDAIAWTGTSSFQMTLSNPTNFTNFNTTSTRVLVPYYTIEAQAVTGSIVPMVPSTTNKIGYPIWSNGSRCAVPALGGASIVAPDLYINIVTGTTTAQLQQLSTVWAG